MNYYLVNAICGHVGNGYGVEKCFPVMAETGREAAAICRSFPRVKHENKHAILNTRKVDMDEYYNQYNRNEYDPYFQAHSKRDCYVLNVDFSNRIDMASFWKKSNKKPKNDRRHFHGISKKAYVNRYLDSYKEENYENY